MDPHVAISLAMLRSSNEHYAAGMKVKDWKEEEAKRRRQVRLVLLLMLLLVSCLCFCAAARAACRLS